MAGLSETGKRVTEYYLQRMSVESVQRLMEDLLREKETQLQKMLQLIHSETCIREKILSFFGEEIRNRPPSCCSVCGTDENHLDVIYKEQSKDRKTLDWSERLLNLLG